MVEQVTPAVVTIRSERRVRNVSQDLPEGLREFFFGDPFGQGRRRQIPERREGGLGSGVIVRPDGYILTNHHVVEGAEQVNVELSDGRSFKAKVIGSDQPSDLAVLKIDGTNLQTLALGDSDALVRESAAHALGEVEDAAAIPALTDLLKSDREPAVRRAAARALGEIVG